MSVLGMYVRIDSVYQLQDVEDLLQQDPLVSNMPLSVSHLLQGLALYEESFGCRYRRYRNRLCVCLEILIPRDVSVSSYPVVAKQFMHNLDRTLLYVCWVVRRKTANYLVFLISERQYKTSGYVYEKLSTHDVYRSSVSGKLCSKSDKSAVLVSRKGSVLLSVPCDFSKKTTLFMVTGKNFTALMSEMKGNLLSIFTSLRSVRKRFYFKRLNRRKAHNRFMMRNAAKINDLILFIENQLNDFADNAVAGHFWDYWRRDIYKLANRYRIALTNLSFSHGRSHLRFTLSTRWDILDSNIDTLRTKFEHDLSRIYTAWAS